MFMLCYKNGGLAREVVADEINAHSDTPQEGWAGFDSLVESTPILGQADGERSMKLGLYFPGRR